MQSAKSFIILSNFYLAQGDAEQALQIANEALNIAANSPGAMLAVARAKMLSGAGLVDGFPGTQQYVGHYQRRFDTVLEVLLLCGRQLRAQMRNDAVVAGQDAVLGT